MKGLVAGLVALVICSAALGQGQQQAAAARATAGQCSDLACNQIAAAGTAIAAAGVIRDDVNARYNACKNQLTAQQQADLAPLLAAMNNQYSYAVSQRAAAVTSAASGDFFYGSGENAYNAGQWMQAIASYNNASNVYALANDSAYVKAGNAANAAQASNDGGSAASVYLATLGF